MLMVSLVGQPLAGCLRRRCEGTPPHHWLQASLSCYNLIELIIVYYVCLLNKHRVIENVLEKCMDKSVPFL